MQNRKFRDIIDSDILFIEIMCRLAADKEIIMNICVYGAASARIDKKYTDEVYKLGSEMAHRGHALVFGAGGTGVMGAAAHGVADAGGKIYGFIPEFFKKDLVERLYLDCTEIKFTQDMRERKAGMEAKADGFVIAPGGIGTLEEFFEILTLRQLGRHNKPIVIFNVFGFYDGLIDYIKSSMDKNFISESCGQLYFVTDNISEAIDYLENPPVLNLKVSELKK